MSYHNSLPGFDAWLTTQPTGDEVEPLPRHLDEARREIRKECFRPSESQVYTLACMLAHKEAHAPDTDAEEHAAESSREDSEDRFGDGPL